MLIYYSTSGIQQLPSDSDENVIENIYETISDKEYQD